MSVNTSASPYYDDFNRDKKFLQILSRPGRALQARELTQSQSIMLDIVKKLSDTILKDGSIISGMAFSATTDSLTIENGLVYLEGVIHQFTQQTIPFTGVGEEHIGVKLVKSIVTYEQDESLRDPASGFKNYTQPGADRLKGEVVLTYNDPNTPAIYEFLDGVLINDRVTPELDVITDQLARRTYDESGNYKVRGFNLYTEDKDDNYLNLIVDTGKAYVLGYEVNKTTSTKIPLEKAKDTSVIQNESNYFIAGTNLYPLNNRPVKQINRVNAEVRVTRERVIRGAQVNGIDYLSKNSISRIERVWQEAPNGTVTWEYSGTTDYQLLNQQSISWALDGSEPNLGETYYVTYRYNKTMVQGTDYTFTVNENGYFVDFTSNLGDDPIPETQFFVDYEFYLARKDLISLDKDGNLVVTKGQSTIPRMVTTPINNDPNVLHLGTVYLAPSSAETITNPYSVTRLDMKDLQDLVRRIEDMEYNQAITALDNVAQAGESPTELKGILSDGFYNLSKADLNHPDFNITLALESGEITLPTSNAQALQPQIDTSNIHSWGRLITAPMTERIEIDQPLATGTMLVNPYAVFNKLGVMKLVPEIDNFVNETKMVVEKQTTSTYTINAWWMFGGSPYTATEKMLYDNLVLDQGQGWATGGWSNKTGTILSSSAKTLLDEAAQYMRQIDVEVHATNLIPQSDNLEVSFDGTVVNATPLAGFSAGTTAGTLKANSKGEAKGKFTIPADVPCGTREVVLANANNTAIGYFTANGRNRVVEETILRTRVTVRNYDPLAQTFQFDYDRIISSVGLYFGSKDDTNNVCVQIRSVVNGYPGTTIFGEKILTPSEVKVSENGTLETKVTFDDPIMCNANTQYCIVVLTDSDVYTMFIAELGKNYLDNTGAVTRQPYVNGTLFSSSNAITWTAHQTMDLKFRVYTATFASTGIIEFEPITNLTADRLVLLSEYLTPANTGCTWEVRYLLEGDSGSIAEKAYQPIGNYEDVDISSVAISIQLRATFTASRYMSPIIARDGISILVFITGLVGSYVSRNVVFPSSASYKTVKQVFEAYVPSGCTVRPTFSTDGGATWVNTSSVIPTVEAVDGNFVRYTFVSTVPGNVEATNFRARLMMTAPNPFLRPRARKFMNICK